MNNASNGDAVTRLTNVVAGAIAQFQADEQQSATTLHHTNFPVSSTAAAVLEMDESTERYLFANLSVHTYTWYMLRIDTSLMQGGPGFTQLNKSL